MFDISWSELLILGIVTLIFVGPKELPVFLRTIGKYVGMVKRQAGEFREQFDSAMREAELDQIRKDMMGVKTDVEKTMTDASRSVANEFDDMKSEFDKAKDGASLVDPKSDALTFAEHDLDAHDADGIPLARPNFDPPKPVETADASAVPAAPVVQPAVAPAVSPAKAAAEAAAASARASGPPAVTPPATADAIKSGA